MQKIKELVGMIKEEIEGSEDYIDLALKMKMDDRKKADVFAKLSDDEMGHVMALHTMVVEIIADYRKENGEPPKEMMIIWDYEHKNIIEEVNDIKLKQMMYKQG